MQNSPRPSGNWSLQNKLTPPTHALCRSVGLFPFTSKSENEVRQPWHTRGERTGDKKPQMEANPIVHDENGVGQRGLGDWSGDS